MADQILAQTGALSPPPAKKGGLRDMTLGKAKRTWSLGRRWTRFLLAGDRRDIPGLVDFVVREHFFGAAQVPAELEALGEILAGVHPERALEIGTASGGTLIFLTRLASPLATIVSVDLPGGKFGGGYSARRRWFYQHFARGRQSLHLFQGDSHSPETLARVRAALDNPELDYLFIDGDHRYDGVRRDFEMYGPLVRRGGLIAFHDIAEGPPERVGGVPKFWREIRPLYRHVEFIKDPFQGGYGIGVLYVD